MSTTNAKISLPQHGRDHITPSFLNVKKSTVSKKTLATITSVILMLLITILIVCFIKFSDKDPMVSLMGMPYLFRVIGFVILLCMFAHTIFTYGTIPLSVSVAAGIIGIIAVILISTANPLLN